MPPPTPVKMMTLALNWLMSVVTALAAKTIPICDARSRISPQFEPCARGNHEESDVIKGRGAHLPRQKPQDDQPACQYGTRKPRQLCAPPDRSRAPSASPPPRASPPGCRCVASSGLQRITSQCPVSPSSFVFSEKGKKRKGLFFQSFFFLLIRGIRGTGHQKNRGATKFRQRQVSVPSMASTEVVDPESRAWQIGQFVSGSVLPDASVLSCWAMRSLRVVKQEIQHAGKSQPAAT